MKVLLVTQSIPHYRLPVYELMCSNTANALDYYVAADDQSKLASLNVLKKDSLDGSSKLKKKWLIYRNLWLLKNFLWQKKLIGDAVSKEYSVVIMTGDIHYLSTWVIALLRRVLNRPTIMWTHGLLKPEYGLKLSIRRFFYSLADVLFLYGERSKTLLNDVGFSSERLVVIYNSLDFEQQIKIARTIDNKDIQELRADLGFNPEDRVLITTGRLTTSKKIDYLLEILPELNQDKVTRLVIVGHGPELENLKQLANKLRVVNKVCFYGACYQEDKLALLMKCSDVFVLPGDAGLSVIHGLTYGIPAVTHDDMNTQKPEVEAIKDGVNGSFYRANDKSDLINKIEYWFSQVETDEKLLKVRCQNVIKQYYNPKNQLNIMNQTVDYLGNK